MGHEMETTGQKTPPPMRRQQVQTGLDPDPRTGRWRAYVRYTLAAVLFTGGVAALIYATALEIERPSEVVLEPIAIEVPAATTHTVQFVEPGFYLVTCYFVFADRAWVTLVPFAAYPPDMAVSVEIPTGMAGDMCDFEPIELDSFSESL